MALHKQPIKDRSMLIIFSFLSAYFVLHFVQIQFFDIIVYKGLDKKIESFLDILLYIGVYTAMLIVALIVNKVL